MLTMHNKLLGNEYIVAGMPQLQCSMLRSNRPGVHVSLIHLISDTLSQGYFAELGKMPGSGVQVCGCTRL